MMTSLRCIVVLGILLGTVTATGSAQVVLPDHGSKPGLRENVFGLGFAGGAATGVGISFRHHLPSSFSYQFTGGIIKANDRLSYDFGAEAQVDLVRGPASRFFAGGGVGYYFAGRSGHNEMNAPTRVGLGLGGEMSPGPGFHVTVELMFTYFSDSTVLPLPQMGIYYYFY